MINQAKLHRTIGRVMELLVRGDYPGIVELTGGRRLTAREIEQAIHDYGRNPVFPPGDSESVRSVVDIEASNPGQWSVYVDVWTEEEGRSDLTLELTLTDSAQETYSVEMDDLHVL